MAPPKGMDFARNQLLKYGWKEGKGLGRNESGITDAIRPKLKFDTQGIGHNASEQFTYHWWEHAFNKAASNIQVASSEEGVQVKMLDDSVDITTRKQSLNKLKKNNTLEYGTFLKTSTLTKGGHMTRIIPETSEPNESGPSFESLTDEDLFRICGGRTAHKGARHGIKLNGKLARIQEQEKFLLDKMHRSKKIFTDSLTHTSDNFTEFIEESDIKMNKEKSKRKQDEESSNTALGINQDSGRSKKIKHKKRKKNLVNSKNDLLENNSSQKTKKSKRKRENICTELVNKKSKKECKYNSDVLNELENNDDDILKLAESEDTIAGLNKKKRKKNKKLNH